MASPPLVFGLGWGDRGSVWAGWCRGHQTVLGLGSGSPPRSVLKLRVDRSVATFGLPTAPHGLYPSGSPTGGGPARRLLPGKRAERDGPLAAGALRGDPAGVDLLVDGTAARVGDI